MIYFRKKELSSTQFADLRKALVGSLDDLVLKDATTVTGDPMGSTANPKENNKHKRCLLVVLAVNINLSSLAAMETDTVIGDVTGEMRVYFCCIFYNSKLLITYNQILINLAL